MARVIEYMDGKKYIRDLKMGKSWMVPEKRAHRERKREGKKEEGRPKPGRTLTEEK